MSAQWFDFWGALQYVIELFYSREFLAAVPLLQWFVVGCLGRIISWPLGYVLLALALGDWFFISEATFTLLDTCMPLTPPQSISSCVT